MNLRKFLDAAFALLYEINERAAAGVDGLAILDKIGQWAAGGMLTPEPASTTPQNEAAMDLLQSRLMGVQGSPTKRKPRRA